MISTHGLFTAKKINNNGIEQAALIEAHFEKLIMELQKYTLDERTRDLMVLKLEEACLYAKKSMSLNPLNQEKEGI